MTSVVFAAYIAQSLSIVNITNFHSYLSLDLQSCEPDSFTSLLTTVIVQ